MTRLTSWVWIPAFLLIVATAQAQEEDPKPKEDPAKKPEAAAPEKPEADPPKKPESDPPAKPEDKPPVVPSTPKKKYRPVTKLQGELIALTGGREMRFRAVLTEPNPQAIQALQKARIDYARAAAKRDLRGMQSAQRNMINQQKNLVRTTHKEITIQPVEDVEVRLAQPKPAFDEMGEIKTYTRAELAKMRGRDNLYDGKFEDLAAGQTLVVTVVRDPAVRIKPGEIPPPPLTNHIVIVAEAPPK